MFKVTEQRLVDQVNAIRRKWVIKLEVEHHKRTEKERPGSRKYKQDKRYISNIRKTKMEKIFALPTRKVPAT